MLEPSVVGVSEHHSWSLWCLPCHRKSCHRACRVCAGPAQSSGIGHGAVGDRAEQMPCRGVGCGPTWSLSSSGDGSLGSASTVCALSPCSHLYNLLPPFSLQQGQRLAGTSPSRTHACSSTAGPSHRKDRTFRASLVSICRDRAAEPSTLAQALGTASGRLGDFGLTGIPIFDVLELDPVIWDKPT